MTTVDPALQEFIRLSEARIRGQMNVWRSFTYNLAFLAVILLIAIPFIWMYLGQLSAVIFTVLLLMCTLCAMRSVRHRRQWEQLLADLDKLRLKA